VIGLPDSTSCTLSQPTTLEYRDRAPEDDIGFLVATSTTETPRTAHTAPLNTARLTH
jgi:hypothetical protein